MAPASQQWVEDTIKYHTRSPISAFIRQSPWYFLAGLDVLTPRHDGLMGRECIGSLSLYVFYAASSCSLHRIQHILCRGNAQASFVITSCIPSFTILILALTAWPMYHHVLNYTSDHTSASTQPTPSTRSLCTTRLRSTHMSYASRTFFHVFHHTRKYLEFLQSLIPITMIFTPLLSVSQPTP